MNVRLLIFNIMNEVSPPKIDTATIIAICALIVSIVSITIGVRYNRKSLEMTKEHNMLSVMPQKNMLHKSSYVENTSELIISNNGLGPALIESVYYYLEGKEYRSFDQL